VSLGRRLTRRGESGFTLIESMMALVVLAVGILALVTLIPLGTKKISTSASRTRASELAAAKAEKLLATPYADPDLDPGSHSDEENPFDTQYYVSWSVEDNQPIASCKRVTVMVRWPTSISPLSARVVVVTPQAGG
jgi:prepilin-type N-terminal cleavage/methylation domain-containing protein